MSSPISVIVLNWNGRHLLPDCLSSLAKQTLQDFETIIVDNGSQDGSQEWISSNYPKVEMIQLRKNIGFCGGNNAGIQAANVEYVVLLNNDTEVAPDWLEQLYLGICTDNQIAACDSKILYFDRRDMIWTCGADYSIAGSAQGRGYQQNDGINYQQPTEVFGAVACSAIYRKSVLNKIGQLDERFFAGYEDIDWSFRARLFGYRILNVPSSRVYHKVSATHINNSPAFIFHGQRNVSFVFLKNMPFELLIRYWPFHLFYIGGSLLYFSKIGRSGAFLKAKAEVIKQWRYVWQQRKQVQSQRIASANEIDRFLDRTWLTSKFKKINSLKLKYNS